MLDPAQIQALSEVIRTGSFEAAAQALNVTPSAVSQRIKALEERLGTALVRRGQPCRPTDAGARLARHGETVALLERQVLSDLGSLPEAQVPTLRIAVNADSLATWLLPALASVPGFLYDLVLDDQDHSADWLRRGEVQAAITAHGTAIAGCNAHPLGRLPYRATASPAFVRHWFADGVTAAALSRAPALTFNRKDRLQALWARKVTGRTIALPTHYIAASHGFVEAAELGLGWGLNPVPLVATALAEGRLVALCPEVEIDTALHWQVARATAAALAPVTRAVRREAAARLG